MQDSNSKEQEIELKVDSALSSSDIEDVKKTLSEIYKLYQKTNRRMDKIIKAADKQQEIFVALNDKLTNIKEEQASSIHKLIEDKKARAKNIMESKRKIFEAHQKELNSAKSNVDELTQLLVEKDTIAKKYAMLQNEYENLKAQILPSKDAQTQNISAYELEKQIDTLLSFGLEKVIFAITQSINKEIIVGKLDSTMFAKQFFKIAKSMLEKNFLSKQELSVPIDKLSLYILQKYSKDMLSIVADSVIAKSFEKNRFTTEFLSSYNGSFVHDGASTIEKAAITDASGNRWMITSIMQHYTQKNQSNAQLQARQDLISTLQEKKDELQKAINSFKEEIDLVANIDDQDMQESTLTEEQELVIAKLKSKIYNNEKEIESIDKMLAAEQGKAILQENTLALHEEKYGLIVSAFVKSMMKSMMKK